MFGSTNTDFQSQDSKDLLDAYSRTLLRLCTILHRPREQHATALLDTGEIVLMPKLAKVGDILVTSHDLANHIYCRPRDSHLTKKDRSYLLTQLQVKNRDTFPLINEEVSHEDESAGVYDVQLPPVLMTDCYFIVGARSATTLTIFEQWAMGMCPSIEHKLGIYLIH